MPAAVVHYRDGGRTLHLRALEPLAKGAAVTYSYLAEEQLCAPYAERAPRPRRPEPAAPQL